MSAVPSVPARAMVPERWRIAEVTRELPEPEVFTWTLEPLDGGGAMTYSPGQFNMVYQFGLGEVPISISGDPESGTLVHTIRAAGAVTRGMAALGAGDVVGVRGPFGSAWPVADAEGRDLVVVAGGIGLAPLRPVIYHAARHRDRFRRVLVLYGTRQPRDILYRRELETWSARLDMEVAVTVDRSAPGWYGDVGVVTRLIDRGGFEPGRTVAMLCGPEVMMRFAAKALRGQGVPDDAVWLSMERNMHCAVGFCGHCQLGPHFVCRDGPVFRLDRIAPFMEVREL